jgi:hypothetical protein
LALLPNNAPIFIKRPPRFVSSVALRAAQKVAGMDDKISVLFKEWLSVFEADQADSANEAIWRDDALREIEARLAATPAKSWKGLAVKLALHCFLQDHGELEGSQAHSAYRDLVRLSGHDPLGEINARFKKSA